MDTKNKIMETAFKLFLKKGFDNVSLSEILKESNITTGGFYYYFDSRETLFLSVINEYIFEYFDKCLKQIKNSEGSPKERLKKMILSVIGYDSTMNKAIKLSESSELIDYRNLHLLYLGSLQNYDIISKRYTEFNLSLIEFVKDLIDESKAQGEISKDLDSDELSIFIQSVIDGTFMLWITVPETPLRKTMNSNIDRAWGYITFNHYCPFVGSAF
jgi:AcrR family transcriptional regulator